MVAEATPFAVRRRLEYSRFSCPFGSRTARRSGHEVVTGTPGASSRRISNFTGSPGRTSEGTPSRAICAGTDWRKRMSLPCHFGISTFTLIVPSARVASSTFPAKTSKGIRPSSARVIMVLTVSRPYPSCCSRALALSESDFEAAFNFAYSSWLRLSTSQTPGVPSGRAVRRTTTKGLSLSTGGLMIGSIAARTRAIWSARPYFVTPSSPKGKSRTIAPLIAMALAVTLSLTTLPPAAM